MYKLVPVEDDIIFQGEIITKPWKYMLDFLQSSQVKTNGFSQNSSLEPVDKCYTNWHKPGGID